MDLRFGLLVALEQRDMCGIAGFLDLKRRFGNQDSGELARMMADRITHRGPDAAATWADATVGIGFGHRRLSIVDLSAAGAAYGLSQRPFCNLL